jgi:soluble lytic murein transglycosylase
MIQRHRVTLAIVIAAAAMAAAGPAHCTWRARADSLRREADRRFEAGEYRRSAELYAAAVRTLEEGAGPAPTAYFAAKKARARYLQALSHERLKQWEEASASYERCLSELPEISDYIHMRLAACHAGRRDYEAAILQLRALTDDGEDSVYDSMAILEMAGYYDESGDIDQALQWYRVYLGRAESYNDRALSHYRIGRVYEKRGDSEAATRSYENVVRSFPRSPHAGEALRAGRAISRAFTDRYSQGLVLYNRRLYSEAVEFFTWYLRHDDELSRAHEAGYFLGRSHQRLGNFQTAAASYEDAICAGPDAEYFDLAWSKLAYCLRARGDIERSLATYDRFVELYPERAAGADLMWEKARLLEEKRRLEEAVSTYSGLAERGFDSPRTDDAMFRKGLCLFKQGRHNEAEAVFAAAVLAVEGDEAARALFWAAKCRQAQRGIGDAAARYADAVLAAPDSYYGVRAGIVLRAAGMPRPVLLPGSGPDARSGASRSSGPRTGGASSRSGLFSVWGSEALEFASWLAEWYDRVYLPAGRAALRREIYSRPAFIRADTFIALGMRDEALRELDVLEEEVGDDPRALDIMVDYSERMGLHRRGIRIAERILSMSPASGLSEAPAYLVRKICPTHFREIVESECGLRGIDPSVAYSLIRQESLFEPEAVSWVGARGLSQIMPATGSWLAGRLGLRGYNRSTLFDPEVNVRFGTEYLSVQIEEFEGDLFRALAAYNGGPDAAARWWEYGGGVDSDVFVEDIGYDQTNDYVRRVIKYSEYYRALNGQ